MRADQRALWALGALRLFLHPALGITPLCFSLSWLIPAPRKRKLNIILCQESYNYPWKQKYHGDFRGVKSGALMPGLIESFSSPLCGGSCSEESGCQHLLSPRKHPFGPSCPSPRDPHTLAGVNTTPSHCPSVSDGIGTECMGAL